MATARIATPRCAGIGRYVSNVPANGSVTRQVFLVLKLPPVSTKPFTIYRVLSIDGARVHYAAYLSIHCLGRFKRLREAVACCEAHLQRYAPHELPVRVVRAKYQMWRVE